MIRYALTCDQRHEFDSWFQNSEAYERQIKRGLVTCPVCNSAKVEKAIMAPRLARSEAETEETEKRPAAKPAPAAEPTQAPPTAPVAEAPLMPMLAAHERELRQKLKELRDHLTQHSDNVGPRFPEEARKMHHGEISRRSIYGQASPEEAKALAEEGVSFHPLPILPDDWN